MIILITGQTGAGKTYFGVNKIAYPHWKKEKEDDIYANFPLTFPNNNERVIKFRDLDEIYDVKNGLIFIDEAQKLFNAAMWPLFPVSFQDKITQHRKHNVNFVTTTQDMAQIAIQFRRLIHDWYHVESVFRFPRSDKYYPLIQLVRVIHRKRNFDIVSQSISWYNAGNSYFLISKLWTKELYDTYADVGLEKFICKIITKNNKTTLYQVGREVAEKKGRRV